ncbi:MAG: SHD1 domain-containing protein, partial [Planctomycetota bacterium]
MNVMTSPGKILRWSFIGMVLTLAGASALADSPEETLRAETPRTWSDQTGGYQVEATLIGVEAGRVALRKTDGRVVRPPLSLLSKSDQAYVSAWEEKRQAGNIFAGGVMEDDDVSGAPEEESAANVSLPRWRSGSEAVAMKPGAKLVFQEMPRPRLPQTDQETVVESRQDARLIKFATPKGLADSMIPLIVDPRGQKSVLKLQNGYWDKEKFTQAVLLDSKTRRTTATTRWEQPIALEDTFPQSSLVVGRVSSGSWGASSELILWSLTRAGKFTERLRWLPTPETGPGSYPKVRFVRIVDDRHVLARVGNTIHLWDLAKRATVWELGVHSWHRPALSRGGKFFAVQNRDRVGIFVTASGKQVGLIPLPSDAVVGLAFSPDASRLAVATGRVLDIFDLQKPEGDKQILLTDKVETFHSSPYWTDDDHVMLSGRLLADVNLGHVIWQYDTNGRGNNSLAMKTGLFRGTAGSHGETTAFAIAIPEQSVLNEVAAVDFSGAVRIDRGTPVRVETALSGSTDSAKVESLLQEGIRKLGWVLDPAASNTVRF